MTEDDRDKLLVSIDSRLGQVEGAVHAQGERLARLEGIVQEMSNGMTRLTWTVSLWGGALTVLFAVLVAFGKR